MYLALFVVLLFYLCIYGFHMLVRAPPGDQAKRQAETQMPNNWQQKHRDISLDDARLCRGTSIARPPSGARTLVHNKSSGGMFVWGGIVIRHSKSVG